MSELKQSHPPLNMEALEIVMRDRIVEIVAITLGTKRLNDFPPWVANVLGRLHKSLPSEIREALAPEVPAPFKVGCLARKNHTRIEDWAPIPFKLLV